MAKKAKSEHLLLIRLSAMGDVAMVVPAILALQKEQPQLRITVLTKPHLAPIFNSLDNVAVFMADVKNTHKGLRGLFKLYGALQKQSITHVADLHNVLRSKVLDFLFWMRGIPVAIVDKGRVEKKKLTRANNKMFTPLKPIIHRYVNVFHKLGYWSKFPEGLFLKKLELSKQSMSFFSKVSSKHIGIAPFAAYSSKMYDLNGIEEVIEELLQKADCQILLFGGGKIETGQLTKLQSKFKHGVQCVAGQLSFAEELGVISNLDVMLAMDSGNGHLAANYGVPVVTIWGVTHPYAGFSPYSQPIENSILPDRKAYPLIPTSIYGNVCPKGYENAINSIPIFKIVQRTIAVLNND